MPSLQGRRVRARPATRRSAFLLLLLAVGFVSGLGGAGLAPARSTGAFPGFSISDEASTKAPAHIEPVISERPAIAIDELPLRERVQDEPFERVAKGTLERGQTLAAALRAEEVPDPTINLLAQELGSVFDFRLSQPGDRFRLELDAEGNALAFRYSTSPEQTFTLHFDGRDYWVGREHAQLTPHVVSLSGVIETSLYEAVRALGEQPQLASDFAEIFAWDLDFSRTVQPGDYFQVLYERLYLRDEDGEESYVRPGRILAARFRGAAGDHTAVYFQKEPGEGSYFRPDGSSVERAFLIAPLRYSRISSSYSSARPHPILKVTRRHPGIDYAAAEGTPIWAVADGTVVFRGRYGASGNLVKVEHPGGYVSHYAHLSRFASGLKVGQRVTQKEVIGYVGQTGLATGPHICFRVSRNGKFINPLELRSPSGESITPAGWESFRNARDGLLSSLDATTRVAIDEAL